jgi:hypothetical protein
MVTKQVAGLVTRHIRKAGSKVRKVTCQTTGQVTGQRSSKSYDRTSNETRDSRSVTEAGVLDEPYSGKPA